MNNYFTLLQKINFTNKVWLWFIEITDAYIHFENNFHSDLVKNLEENHVGCFDYVEARNWAKSNIHWYEYPKGK